MDREEILRSARNLYENPGTNEALKAVLEETYPELKESEDERIRKWLIEMVEELRKANPTNAEYNGDCSEAIAYLEKQKEHKPEIKYVYPIFKVGDTIKPKAYNQNHRIDKIKDDNYVLDNGFTFPIVGQDVWEIVEQKPVKLNDDTEVGLDRALQIVKNAKGNLCGYQSDDGIYECNHAIQTLERILKSGIKQQPAEWSEEDKKMLEAIVGDIHCGTNFNAEVMREANIREKWLRERLKSLRPQPKVEREPMEIKYGGRIYQVHGMRALPGGASGYIIEDEPGHYDCIMNPEEVLGGGYGVKQNGSPYPTKEATFDEPHWKPSKEQIQTLTVAIDGAARCEDPWWKDSLHDVLLSLHTDLQKLL